MVIFEQKYGNLLKQIVELLWCNASAYIQLNTCFVVCVIYLFVRLNWYFKVSWQKGTQCRKWNLKGFKSFFITKDIISNRKRCALSIRTSNIQQCWIAKVSSISCGTLFNQQCLYIYLSVLRNIYHFYTLIFGCLFPHFVHSFES